MRGEGRSVPGRVILFLTIILVLIGIVMLASSSFTFSYKYYGVPHQFLFKQLVACFIGLLAMLILSRINYQLLCRVDHIILIGALSFTSLTLFPGLSSQGRWIDMGLFNFQPAELLKPALILFVGSTLVRKSKNRNHRNFSEGFLPYLIILSVVGLMLILQPDFGMTMLLGLIVLAMLYVNGSPLRYFIYLALSSLPFIFLFIFMVPYRRERILSFLDPFRYKLAGGYQIIQSLTALGSGGIMGRGLGGSREKLFYLPSAYNDFIFSITGEELGLLGSLLVVGLFAFWGYMGIRIALNAPDRLGTLIAFGITFAICIQAGLNIGVIVAVLPVTGLTLPFISFGGSSMIVSLGMVGILLNISRSELRRRKDASLSSRRGNRWSYIPGSGDYGFTS